MPSNQQRREAAKRKLQRQMVRREQHARAQRRRLLIAGAIAAVLVIAGGVWLFSSVNSSDNAASSDATTSGTDTATSTGPTTPCTFTVAGTPAKAVKPPTNLSPANTGTVDATVTFATGPVVVSLDRANAPCAVESFVSLASQQFFDDTKCHRLTDAETLKILQCGDPSGAGTGGPGYTFADELKGTEKYTTGVVAMANSGADTNGSQFFFVWGDSALPASYTVLGKVSSGMDVIDAIGKQGVADGSQDGKPKADAAIKTVTVPAESVTATGSYATSSPATDTAGASEAAGASDTDRSDGHRGRNQQTNGAATTFAPDNAGPGNHHHGVGATGATSGEVPPPRRTCSAAGTTSASTTVASS